MKMLSKTIAIIFAMVFLATMSACWDLREIDSIAIVTGVGIDSAEENLIDLTLQIGKTTNSTLKKSGGSSSEEKMFTNSEVKAKSISESLANIRAESSRTPFLHHAQVLIIGKDFAERGVKKYMDAFLREHEMRLEIYCAMTHGTAKDVLTKAIEPEKQSSLAIARMVKSSSNLTGNMTVSLLNFISHMEDVYSASFIPIVNIKKENDEEKISYDGFAIFREGKLCGELDYEMTKGFAWTTDKMNKRSLEVTTEKGSFNADVFSVENQKSIELTGSESARAKVILKAKLEVTEIMGFDGDSMDEIIDYIEKQAEEKIKEEITRTFKYLQGFGGDIYKFAEILHKSSPSKWHMVSAKWEDIFNTADLQIEAKVKLMGTGKIYEALEMSDRS